MTALEVKTCRACHQEKPLAEYDHNWRREGGLEHRCRVCRNAYQRSRYWRKRPGRVPRVAAKPFSPEELSRVLAAGVLRCRLCGVEKDLKRFRLKRAGPGRTYLYHICKDCVQDKRTRLKMESPCEYSAMRKRSRCKAHGMTPDQYDAMWKDQNGKCAVCGRSLPEERTFIDHDHSTGVVRGLVHQHCNSLLGHAHEDVCILAGAIRYLLGHIRRKATKTPDEAILALATCVEVRP